MSVTRGLAARLRAIARGRVADRELDEEIRFHLEQEIIKNERLGMTPEEARRRALRDFGGVAVTREEHRDTRGARWLGDFTADAHFALRTLSRSPALAIAAIVTLALGVGANTAIFSAVNAVLLRPLPLREPGRLLMLWEENPEKGWHMQTAAPANFLDWKEQVSAFDDVAAYLDFKGTSILTGEGSPRIVSTAYVTGNFFSMLGVRAEIGRAFLPDETWKTGTPVVVLSHQAWATHFGADSAVLGRTIRLDGEPMQVVGVMPNGFYFPYEKVDSWVPTAWDPADRAQTWFRRAHFTRPIARLKPGVEPRQANAQLQSVVQRLKVQYPETNAHMGAGITPLHDFIVGDTRLPLLVLLSAVGLLLLIACANVGNLLLAQAAGRERETALRLALGAGRSRVVRQALTESLVLSAIGGGLGLALGIAGTRALTKLQPAGILPVREYGVDWTVLVFVLTIVTASGLLFGTLPALWSGRRVPAEALRAGRSSGEGRRMRRWGDALVVAEVALSLMLTIGAGLLVRTLWELQSVHPGFDARGVLTASLSLQGTAYDSAARREVFYDELLRRARSLPGVVDAAVTSAVPLDDLGYTSDFTVAGWPPGEYATEVIHRMISADYFRTMRVPLLAGRAFTAQDGETSPPVAIINETLARRHFPGQDPIGRRIVFDKFPDSTSVWRTIVGVVGDEHQITLTGPPRIESFVPYSQERLRSMTVVVRTTSDPSALAASVRRIVGELDGSLALSAVRTMEEVRLGSLARQRFLMVLMLVFAVVGLVLAVVGVYGVLAHFARRRTREMGIRVALGAQSTEVRWLVVRHGLRLTMLGLAIGGVAALGITRAMGGLLYNVPPWDPSTFAVVSLLLAATSLIAAWVPAHRASRADPMVALRGE
jgi:putative ABC transport system permease protein